MASPSELIAHKRDDDEIARHIGAKKVIFQTLDDLKDACLEAVTKPLIRKVERFEVGVFDGKYVSPVPPGYFEHLERVRGESRKMKVMDRARAAVANGSAGAEEIQMATNGVEVNDDGKVVPASPPLTNGSPDTYGTKIGTKRKTSFHDGDRSPKNRMDIGLHNQADFDFADL